MAVGAGGEALLLSPTLKLKLAKDIGPNHWNLDLRVRATLQLRSGWNKSNEYPLECDMSLTQYLAV